MKDARRIYQDKNTLLEVLPRFGVTRLFWKGEIIFLSDNLIDAIAAAHKRGEFPHQPAQDAPETPRQVGDSGQPFTTQHSAI